MTHQTDDLVSRLRAAHRYGGDKALYESAADEIERLIRDRDHYESEAHLYYKKYADERGEADRIKNRLRCTCPGATFDPHCPRHTA